MTKIEALNELPVTDWSCSCGECEYIMTYNSDKVRAHLIGAGFTEEQINEASDTSSTDLDLATLAFNYTDANWWKKDSGFCIAYDELMNL